MGQTEFNLYSQPHLGVGEGLLQRSKKTLGFAHLVLALALVVLKVHLDVAVRTSCI